MRIAAGGPVALLASLLLVVGACVPSKVQVDTYPELEKYPLQTIAVLPFGALQTPQVVTPQVPEPTVPEGVKRSDISIAMPPPSERLDQPTQVVTPHAAHTVTRVFFRKLHVREDLLVISPDEAQAALDQLGVRPAETISKEVARQVARRLKADAALVGQVSVYREREGSKLGANPAVVGFEVRLIGADGSTLWKGNYYERQRPMNEDLWGFLERGGVFVTAEELAAYGAERLVEKFPSGTPPQAGK